MGMLGALIRSFRKSGKLRKISLDLGRPMLPVDWMADLMTEDRPRLARMKRAEEDLYSLCESDPILSSVMAAHGADRETLRAVYDTLMAAGAGGWVRGHFVAASTLAFACTLDYALQELGDESRSPLRSEHPDWSRRSILMHVAYKLLEYFEQSRAGPVE